MELGLREKAVLVTAASKGIGKAIAEEFAEEGSRISICARGAEHLDETAEELKSQGVDVLAIQADVTKPADVQRVVDETLAAFDQIDVLVNNAGDAWVGRTVDTTDEEWAYTLDVNLYSAIRFTRSVVPHMRTGGGGRIINISSVSGHTMTPALVDYQTAKAGLIAFSKSMSIDLAPDNILVNCVCPGPIRTPLWDRVADSLIGEWGDSREEVYQNAASELVTLGRHGNAEEVAAVVVFLASERASYVCGVAYDVDGGFTKSTF